MKFNSRRLKLFKQQDLADQRTHLTTLMQDHIQIAFPGLLHAHDPVQYTFGDGLDCRQRRFELMGHIRKKLPRIPLFPLDILSHAIEYPAQLPNLIGPNRRSTAAVIPLGKTDGSRTDIMDRARDIAGKNKGHQPRKQHRPHKRQQQHFLDCSRRLSSPTDRRIEHEHPIFRIWKWNRYPDNRQAIILRLDL